MKVYILEWNWSDGYESSNAVIGAYTTYKGAEEAWDKWIANELGDYGMGEEYEMCITEMDVL